jgi:hypothetical protein
MKDLILSVADSYQEKVMEALLPRVPVSSGTKPFSFDIIRNIGNDSGSYNDSHELLRPAISQYSFALVIFDYEGTGIENKKSRVDAELEVERLLSNNGWENRNAVAVIDPEVENWIWSDNPHVQSAIGWERSESLYVWARRIGKIPANEFKPIRPKETLEEALRISKTSKSSAIYKKIAAKVSYKNCTDPAFCKVISKLQEWFPLNSDH